MSDNLPEDLAIRARGLSKRYYLGSDEERSLKSLFLRKVRGRHLDVLEVLRGIDLDVPKGQALGICGANGAGKSTLLKLIAGITHPSDGTLSVSGRVASLLELGAGFHPEMTGEENVLLNGVILGLPERDLNAKMEAIFSDAGLSRFAKTPIKHYSTGMVQRLGFSIASHLDPDILILDEIFAVGDALFRESAVDIFRRFKARRKTILLVSHDLSILENFCDRVVMLSDGGILMDGPPKVVTHQYAALVWQHQYQIGVGGVPYAVTNRLGDQRMRLERVTLLDGDGDEARAFRQFSPMRIRFTIVSEDCDLSVPYISVKILNEWSVDVCQTILGSAEGFDPAPNRFEVELVLESLLLNPGNYHLEVIVAMGRGLIMDSWSYAESFSVIPSEVENRYSGAVAGIFFHPARWLPPSGTAVPESNAS